MIRPIVKDPLFLAQPSEEATSADLQTALDLGDTLRAHLDGCVGMAANMIGIRKRIIAVCSGPMILTMLNPKILRKSSPYETEEGCLSLQGVRRTTRWREIQVTWLDLQSRRHTETFRGFAAQVIQHEIDHCEGILI